MHKGICDIKEDGIHYRMNAVSLIDANRFFVSNLYLKYFQITNTFT